MDTSIIDITLTFDESEEENSLDKKLSYLLSPRVFTKDFRIPELALKFLAL